MLMSNVSIRDVFLSFAMQMEAAGVLVAGVQFFYSSSGLCSLLFELVAATPAANNSAVGLGSSVNAVHHSNQFGAAAGPQHYMVTSLLQVRIPTVYTTIAHLEAHNVQ